MDTTPNLVELLKQLQAHGHTPETIAEALQGRVVARTVYRWRKGEHLPQNKTDLAALRELLDQPSPKSKTK